MKNEELKLPPEQYENVEVNQLKKVEDSLNSRVDLPVQQDSQASQLAIPNQSMNDVKPA